MKTSFLLIIFALVGCQSTIDSAGAESREVVDLAATRLEGVVEKAGDRIESAIDRLQVTLQTAGEATMDRAGDRLDASIQKLSGLLNEAISALGLMISASIEHLSKRVNESIDRIPEATKETTKEANDFLDRLSEWWRDMVYIVVAGAAALYAFIQKRRATLNERTARVLVETIDEEHADTIKTRVQSKLTQDPHGTQVQRVIRKARGKI